MIESDPKNCQQICELISLRNGSQTSPELVAHLAHCDSCRQWAERCQVALDALQQAATVLDGLHPAPIRGPWQTQPLVETASPVKSLPRTSEPRQGTLAAAVWLVALAASVLAMVAVEQRPWVSPSTNASLSRTEETTLALKPIRDGHPSRAGLLTLARWQLPSTCVVANDNEDAEIERPTAIEQLLRTRFDCCTRCHAAGNNQITRPRATTAYLIAACGICHDAAFSDFGAPRAWTLQ